jgi:hypothetical protein
MSRGLANHHLYLARLLIEAWAGARARQDVAAQLLDQAFAPGAREHLLRAYGHYLLHILAPGQAEVSDPPRSCDELPAREAGKAMPGEIAEFRRLERDGWLAGLLLPLPPSGATSRRRGDTLAVSASADAFPDPDTLTAWRERLQSLFERMDDSLEEC